MILNAMRKRKRWGGGGAVMKNWREKIKVEWVRKKEWHQRTVSVPRNTYQHVDMLMAAVFGFCSLSHRFFVYFYLNLRYDTYIYMLSQGLYTCVNVFVLYVREKRRNKHIVMLNQTRFLTHSNPLHLKERSFNLHAHAIKNGRSTHTHLQ